MVVSFLTRLVVGFLMSLELYNMSRLPVNSISIYEHAYLNMVADNNGASKVSFCAIAEMVVCIFNLGTKTTGSQGWSFLRNGAVPALIFQTPSSFPGN